MSHSTAEVLNHLFHFGFPGIELVGDVLSLFQDLDRAALPRWHGGIGATTAGSQCD